MYVRWLNVIDIYQMQSKGCIKIIDAQQERIINNYTNAKLKLLKTN